VHLLLGSEETVRRSEVGLLAAEVAWLRAAELPKLTALEELLSGAATPASGGARSAAAPAKRSPPLDATGDADPEPEPEPATDEAPRSVETLERSPEEASSGEASPERGSERASPAAVDPGSAPPSGPVHTADAFLELLSRYRQPLAAHLSHADALRIEDNTLRVFTDDPAFLERALQRPANREALERALGEGLGEGAGWELVTATRSPEEAATEPEPADEEETAQVAGHPTVQAALELFGGTIESIEPREEP
jgi:hypothetical protein